MLVPLCVAMGCCRSCGWHVGTLLLCRVARTQQPHTQWAGAVVPMRYYSRTQRIQWGAVQVCSGGQLLFFGVEVGRALNVGTINCYCWGNMWKEVWRDQCM